MNNEKLSQIKSINKSRSGESFNIKKLNDSNIYTIKTKNLPVGFKDVRNNCGQYAIVIKDKWIVEKYSGGAKNYVRINNFEFQKIDQNAMDIHELILDKLTSNLKWYLNTVIEFDIELINEPKLFFQKHKENNKKHYKDLKISSYDDDKKVFIIAVEEEDYQCIYDEFRWNSKDGVLIKYIKNVWKRKIPCEIWICRYEKQFKDGQHRLKQTYIDLSEWANGVRKWIKETEQEERDRQRWSYW